MSHIRLAVFFLLYVLVLEPCCLEPLNLYCNDNVTKGKKNLQLEKKQGTSITWTYNKTKYVN